MSSAVPAVQSSVRILERLARDWPRGVPTAVIVGDLELNRSTCYNILATLRDAGWVTNLGSREGWRLGSGFFALGAVSRDNHVMQVQGVIDDLSEELGLVVFVAERYPGGGYSVIAQAERHSGVRVTAAVGDRFPFSAPALMQAFEAWTDPAEFNRLVARNGLKQFTPHTVTQLDAVHGMLASVRRDGFSSSVRQYDLAQGGVAAPIFDARGRVTMALCTLGFSTLLNESNVAAVGIRLREAAEQITLHLGGMSPRMESLLERQA